MDSSCPLWWLLSDLTPCRIFLKKYSFKKSIILGLLLFGAGAIFFVPADQLSSFLSF